MKLRILTISLVVVVLVVFVFLVGETSQNLLSNPGFEEGTTGFFSDYQIGGPESFGTIRVGSDPNQFNGGWPSMPPFSGAYMLLVDGGDDPSLAVWKSQKLNVVPDSTYFFSFAASSLFQPSPADLQVIINGQTIGRDIVLRPSVGAWTQVYVYWKSGSASTATISLVDRNTDPWGNDFALDDLNFAASVLPVSWEIWLLDAKRGLWRDVGGISGIDVEGVLLGIVLTALGVWLGYWALTSAGFGARANSGTAGFGDGLVSLQQDDQTARAFKFRTRPMIREIQPTDRVQWDSLWQGYLTFYKTELPAAVTEVLWGRFFNPAEPVNCLVAEEDGKLLGLVHYIFHRNTWEVEDVCYLEDLFTAPEARGKGVGRALIEAVYEKARQAKSKRVYWMTHETNKQAMILYDQVADKPGFVQYRKYL